MRSGRFDNEELERQLNNRGLMNRFFGGYAGKIDTPWKIYPVGVLFGLGFDTATEVALLVLAGTAVAGDCRSGHPVAAYPLRRRDELVRHDRRVLHEFRLRLGLLEAHPQGLLQPDHHRPVGFRGLLHRHDRDPRPHRTELHLDDPFFSFFQSFNINTAGFIIVGAFVATWVAAAVYWHFGNVEEKWDASMIPCESNEAAVSI